MKDELLGNILKDNSALFKKALDTLNKLEEAEDLLREWKELSRKRMTANSGVDADYVIELDKKTDRFLGMEEGKNE